MASLKQLSYQRGQIKGKITRLQNILLTLQPGDLEVVRERYEALPEVLRDFEGIQAKIANFRIQENADDLEQKQQDDERETEQFEYSYYKVRADAKAKLNVVPIVTEPNTADNVRTISRVKLPEIKLPTFGGDCQKWTEFQDVFETTIHNKSYLSSIEKFQYLRGLLVDDAAKVVSALSTTAENYQEAWDLLKAKYDNKKIIINSHLRELLNLPEVTKTNYEALNQIITKIRSHTQALKVLGAPIEHWDMILIHIVTNKLDFYSRTEWEKLIGTKPNDQLPTLKELLEFLTARCQTLQILNKERPEGNQSRYRSDRKVMLATAEQTKCEYCQENHFINRCERFGELSTQDKWNEVHRLRLCGNCLRKGHISKDCKGGDCRICSKHHNTVLHADRKEYTPQGRSNTQNYMNNSNTPIVACNTQESSTSQATEEKENRPPEKMTVAHCAKQLNSRVVLSTAQVYVIDIEDKPIRCRALLDPGSQLNLVTQELAQKLKLPLKRIDIPLSGISQSSVKVQYSVTIELESLTSKFHNKQDYLILPRITERLPQVQLDISSFNIPDGILLADPDFNVPGDIDMLIGAGLFWKLLCAGQVLQPKGQPVLHKTLLGWIVGGEQVIKNPSQVIKNVCNLNVISTVEENIERLWKMEELPMARQLTAEERYCEEQFKDTHTRNESGRFKVRLPQNPDVQLGNSEKEATRRYYALAERLKNNPELRKDYMEFLNEYEEAGHMSRIKVKDKGDEICYYLPHHPVIRAESSTTKVRVVFDGSAKTSLQTSLNDRLLPGPNLQEEIINIILRFRMHEFVITADIAQMFRQVEVAEQDRNLQRIIWRKDGDQNLRIYELNTVTYGTACAPYLAMRCLKQLALDDREKYPRAATALTRDFYMDDVLTGSKSLEDTIELQNQLTQLLKAGHFELRKWRTNDTRVLEHLADECKAKKLLVLDKQEAVKTLGLLWDNTKDILKFNLTIKKMPKITKRTILSTISEIYDPIGFIGPVIMQAKVLLQELWIWKIAWDEAVPASIETTWNNYYGTLGELNRLEITRNVNPRNGAAYVSLHGFGDASEKGYGACIYALSYNENGEASCLLVSSKSRVAPLKKITLPRLELCAAWLLAKLLNLVVKALGEEQIKDVVLWSDSTIVLHWLRTPPNQLKTFVANRVAEIQELTKTCEWKHVPTKDNPADILSRGVTADQLIRNKLWWHGPAWLPYKAEWPKQKIDFINPVPEKRAAVMLITINPMINIFSKYSSFNKLTRIIAYCLRFVRYSRKRGIKGPVIVEELIRSEKTIIRIIQQEGFPEEVQALKNGRELNTRSKILMLHPFLDGEHLLRVGGRLQQATVPEGQKHPLVLPAKHFITRMMMRETHVKLKHCGPEQLLNSVRTKYWPMSGRREARKITRSCIACFKFKPKKFDTIMAELPESRVRGVERPFATTGIDYAGPLQMRESKRRGRIPISKVYIAVFTCFLTKAVHLELVTDLTTEAFLAALRRFVARRGICQVIYSDNGTNFVGAARELREVYEFLAQKQDAITTGLSHQRIIWKFIPPRAPHFGGLWEAAVKATKRHLYKVTQGLIYTYEEYYTLLVEIEAVLNSRPLTPLSSDPHDLSPLTPSHFLIGVSPNEPVTKDYTNVSDNCLSRWQHIQKLKQDFWHRWKSEYLHQLQTRSKWVVSNENIKIGTLVLLVDDNTAPLHWALGRVVQVHPGTDGVVRVVTVKTSTGEFKRAVKKLCALPFDK